ncbi:MAG: hypothetical protein ACK4NR_06485 [Micavibrio sp.]
MSTLKHAGIDMVENLRERGDRDDQQILNRLHIEKSALNIQMGKTEPAQLKPADIQSLRKYEVAIAYLNIKDPTSDHAVSRLKKAISGFNPSDQPNDSLRYERRREYALQTDTPKERTTIRADFS